MDHGNSSSRLIDNRNSNTRATNNDTPRPARIGAKRGGLASERLRVICRSRISEEYQEIQRQQDASATTSAGNGFPNLTNTATNAYINNATNLATTQTSPNYSARNSLRTATSFTNANDQTMCLQTMPEFNAYCIESMSSERVEVRDMDEYQLVRPDTFLRVINDRLHCILCGRKTAIDGNHAIDSHLASNCHNHHYYLLKTALCDIPPENGSFQSNVIKQLLREWYNAQIPTKKHINLRNSIIDQFNVLLREIDPQCRAILVGSFATYTSLIKSDINLELVHRNSNLFETDPRAKNSIHHKLINDNADLGFQINYHTLHYDLIPNAYNTLKTLKETIDALAPRGYPLKVVSDLDDLNAKVPSLVLQDCTSGIKLSIICYAESCQKLASLLGTYMTLDDRARILSVLVKYWAKICRIDSTDAGTLPPDAYVILVIYFLQRVHPPVLPCIHETIGKDTKTTTWSDINLSEKFEDLDLEAPIFNTGKANVAFNDIINDSVLDSAFKTDNPDLTSDECAVLDDEEDDLSINPENPAIKRLNWSSTNTSSIQSLFVHFLKFMSSEFSDSSTVITIRTLKEITLVSKRWTSQIKSIENPVRPRSNIARCIGSQRIFEYMRYCFRRGFQYITLLPTDINLRSRLKTKDQDLTDLTKYYCQVDKLAHYFRSIKRKAQGDKERLDFFKELIDDGMFAKDIELLNHLTKFKNQNDALISRIAKLFSQDHFLPKDVAAVTFCRLCKQSGHLRKSCPRNRVENLYNESEDYNVQLDIDERTSLDHTLFQCFNRDRIHPKMSKDHVSVVQELTAIINARAGIGINCHLELFGSTVNNLGSHDSDLDICMTLEGNTTGKGIDFVEVMRKVYNVLIQIQTVDNVQPIISTRVPIIKFTYRQYDVDLSMYNLCALYNSKLLKSYSSIDDRVAPLFYVVKKYAKECLIANASQGTLSSYAWSLLVIHYLQHTTPPILPVLQEVEYGQEKPMIGINGWNVWFNDKITSMPQKNTMTLTQLYKGFLLYYGNFDFRYYVVSIRKSNPLTRFEKSWNNCMMAIEDPFELTYNLASRLDDLMAIYIINSFALNFRYIVHCQQIMYKESQRGNSTVVIKETKLFNGRNIMGKDPPFRGCRQCHRVGHRFKDCPSRRKERNMPFPDSRPTGDPKP